MEVKKKKKNCEDDIEKAEMIKFIIWVDVSWILKVRVGVQQRNKY